MPSIHVDDVGDMAVVECEGRFVRSEDAYKLRDAVTSRTNAHTVVVDLTETYAIGGGVIGMLVYLQRWAHDHDIRFKLFNPSKSVREKLEHTNSMSEFAIASLDEMMALLGRADPRYALASRVRDPCGAADAVGDSNPPQRIALHLNVVHQALEPNS